MNADDGYSRRGNLGGSVVRSWIYFIRDLALTSMSSMVQDEGNLRGQLGRCRGLKAIKSCSYSLLHTLLLLDVSFSHNAQRTDRQTDRQMTV